MFRHVLRHRLVAFLSYRAVAFNTNGQIHFGIHYALWAGLTARPHERLCISSVCSSLQDLPTEVKPETSQDKKKRRKKVTKEKVCEELSLDENGKDFEASKKKTRKRRTEKVKRPEKLTSDVWVNENQAEDRPPPLSFPFEGSSYAEADDEFGLYHHGSRDMHCSGDKSVIHREENYSSEDRYYRISSAGVSVVYPSVTTVLRQTVTKGQYYMLRNWRRSMIKEHGEEEFESILKQIRNTGTHFHQVSVFRNPENYMSS